MKELLWTAWNNSFLGSQQIKKKNGKGVSCSLTSHVIPLNILRHTFQELAAIIFSIINGH